MEHKNDQIIDITPDVKWIGILDYDIVTFDIVMTTEYGTTYNSYFINAEKKTLIETAKEKFSEQYIAKIRKLCDLSEIEYIVLNHTEPDHSGALRQLVDLAPQATVVGSGNAIRYLNDIVGKPFKSLVAKEGDTLDLGNKTLKFISAPNLHWPDSMYTWLEEDRLLFTCDSFGAHFCDERMFDDMVGDYHDAFKYYFDVILKPFSRFMVKAIEKIRPLDIAMICTGHGPILRSNWKKIVNITEKYACEYINDTTGRQKPKVLVTYVSAYGYTKQMAESISDGIKLSGKIDTEILDIESLSLGDLDARLVLSDGLLVGSPTINQNTLLPVYRLFAAINPLRDKGKPAAAFGSFGWSGEAPKIISEVLKSLKLKVMEEPAAFKFSPDNDKGEALVEYGKAFGEKMLEECGQQ
ncbi:MAG: FprA family A-type flavoprotein [Bacteroidales bacterium]|nr:FprA family A-type flavoprotein [Bacteroidales bacterium]